MNIKQTRYSGCRLKEHRWEFAYNVLISGMSDTMDIAYKNTLGSRKSVHITYIHYVCI